MPNSNPEIIPNDAFAVGAFIVGTGRSDFDNQVNNVLAFSGIFRGALDVRVTKITSKMMVAAAIAISESVIDLSPKMIVPHALDKSVALKVAEAVKNAWLSDK